MRIMHKALPTKEFFLSFIYNLGLNLFKAIVTIHDKVRDIALIWLFHGLRHGIFMEYSYMIVTHFNETYKYFNNRFSHRSIINLYVRSVFFHFVLSLVLVIASYTNRYKRHGVLFFSHKGTIYFYSIKHFLQ